MTAQTAPARDRLSVAFALSAAALFGLSAPAGKALLAVTDPWLLAGLLYLGSAYRSERSVSCVGCEREAPLERHDWPWLGVAILTGGVIAPVLLMFGLSRRVPGTRRPAHRRWDAGHLCGGDGAGVGAWRGSAA